MKDEYDFSNAERGKFFHSEAILRFPANPEQIEEILDELYWDAQFAASQDKLAKATQRAEEEIAAGKSEPMDFSRL